LAPVLDARVDNLSKSGNSLQAIEIKFVTGLLCFIEVFLPKREKLNLRTVNRIEETKVAFVDFDIMRNIRRKVVDFF